MHDIILIVLLDLSRLSEWAWWLCFKSRAYQINMAVNFQYTDTGNRRDRKTVLPMHVYVKFAKIFFWYGLINGGHLKFTNMIVSVYIHSRGFWKINGEEKASERLNVGYVPSIYDKTFPITRFQNYGYHFNFSNPHSNCIEWNLWKKYAAWRKHCSICKFIREININLVYYLNNLSTSSQKLYRTNIHKCENHELLKY